MLSCCIRLNVIFTGDAVRFLAPSLRGLMQPHPNKQFAQKRPNTQTYADFLALAMPLLIEYPNFHSGVTLFLKIFYKKFWASLFSVGTLLHTVALLLCLLQQPAICY
jgi:hypothetical protein